MITSTDQAFTELGTPVPVDTYTRAESVAYLGTVPAWTTTPAPTGSPTSLGTIPLALAQAAATIRRRHWTYPHYLERLRTTSITQLMRRLPGHDYPMATAPALLIGITGLEADDPTGHTNVILRLLSVLSRDGIPRDPFSNHSPTWTTESVLTSSTRSSNAPLPPL